MPRPTKKTDDVIILIKQAAALDCSVPEMAHYGGIAKDTLYIWLKEDKEFSDEIESLRNRPVLKAREEIIKGMKGNPELALKYLERKRKNEFSTRQEQAIDDKNRDKELELLEKILDKK